MFEYATPESVGISSEKVLEFIKTLENYNLSTHSIIMARGNKIFTEAYYAPFHRDFKHRMYSVSKSFMAIAVGFLIQDGKISLDDKLVDFFPEYIEGNPNINENFKFTTLRHLITMQSSGYNTPPWIEGGVADRAKRYFDKPAARVPGTAFYYDSHGSAMLGTIVERVTGKPFLEYLKEKCLLNIGFSKDSYCIMAPGGHSFGDSGVMCTSLDLLRFAKFVLNKGSWNGVQYLNADFVKEATKYQVASSSSPIKSYDSYGYGYLIWKAPRDGFAFIGMGDQFAICDPEKDFIFIITSDNQGMSGISRTVLYHELYSKIVDNLGSPLPENPEAQKKLYEHIKNMKLFALSENTRSDLPHRINGITYTLDQNPMGMEYVRFDFEAGLGKMSYKNAQGEKELVFGIGYNEFSLFPQEGYSDLVASEPSKGNRYKCAASADFPQDNMLRIKVQIIDKYFGNADMLFSFNDRSIGISMQKTAEAFLNEYSGYATGKAD